MSEEDKNKGEGLITVEEIADRIQVGTDWVYDAVNVDGLPCIKYNARLWRFHWPSVLAWLQKR